MNLLFQSYLHASCEEHSCNLNFIHQVAMKHPSAVTACNLDLENLITDSNRSIATLAITTLLKTGSESSVDRLMKQISSFVSEISDEFKVRSSSCMFTLVSAAFPYPSSVELNVSVVLRWWWCRPSALFVRSIPGSTASWWTSCPTCSEMM